MNKTKHLWRTLALLALVCSFGTACEEEKDEKEPDTPVTPVNPGGDDEDDNTVYSKGGTVTFEDLTLTFPSGVYPEGWGSEVEVKKRAKGSVASGDELSDCYYLSFYADTRKPITVKLPAEKGNDVWLAVRSKGIVQSSGNFSPSDMISMLPTTYSGGYYTAQIPAFEIGKGFGDDFAESDLAVDAELTIALVETANMGASARQASPTDTRAARRVSYVLRWTPSNSKEVEKDLLIRDQIMPDVLDKLQLMGFELPQGDYIPIFMEEIKGEKAAAWGVYNMNSLCAALDNVIINKPLFKGTLSEKDIIELRCTLLHECQHYIQSHGYGKEWTNYGRAMDYALGNAQWQILDECSAVWCEKFYDPNPGLTLSWAYEAVRDFFPDDIWCSHHFSATKTSLDVEVSDGMAFDRCGDHGYGLSLFVMHLAKLYGDNTPVKLFEARKAGAKTVKECFEKYGVAVGNKDILKYDFLEEFMYQACTKQIHAGIDFNGLCSKAGNDVIVRQSSEPTTNIKRKMPAVGAEVHSFSIIKSPIDNPQLVITQASPDIITSIYLVQDGDGRYPKKLGEVTGGSTYTFTDMDKITTGKSKPMYSIYTISIPCNEKPATLDLTFSLEKGATLTLSPNPLEFEAEGGTLNVTVTTNQASITGSIADKSWLTVTKSGTTLLKVTATANPTYGYRDNTVIVRARDADGNVMAEQTLTIRQKPKERKDYSGYFVNFWQSKDEKNSLTLGNHGEFTKKFAGSATVEGEYTLVSYEEKEGANPWDKTWTCTIIDPEGNTVTFNGGWSHSMYTGDTSYIIYEGVEMVGGEWWM